MCVKSNKSLCFSVRCDRSSRHPSVIRSFDFVLEMIMIIIIIIINDDDNDFVFLFRRKHVS